MKKVALLVGLLWAVWACSSPKSEEQNDSVNSGEIVITADESLKRLVDALVMVYEANYPRTKINVEYMPENMAVAKMLKGEARLAATTRQLFPVEVEALKRDNFTQKPAIVGLEGVALIANKNVGLKEISLPRLKEILDGKTKYQVGFDNSNSSNLNYLIEKLKVEDIKKAKVSAAKNTEDLIEFVQRNPNTIGVIGMTWISDQHSPQAAEIKSKVQVLAVSKNDGEKAWPPTAYSIDMRQYPLERLIYFHIRESYWGLGSGFQRFACTQTGQLIVEKEGLQPYYIFDKQLNIKKEELKD